MILPTLPVFLSYKGGLFQVVEVTAANYQWMYFDDINSSSKSPGFMFPGLYGLDKFHRT